MTRCLEKRSAVTHNKSWTFPYSLLLWQTWKMVWRTHKINKHIAGNDCKKRTKTSLVCKYLSKNKEHILKKMNTVYNSVKTIASNYT